MYALQSIAEFIGYMVIATGALTMLLGLILAGEIACRDLLHHMVMHARYIMRKDE